MTYFADAVHFDINVSLPARKAPTANYRPAGKRLPFHEWDAQLYTQSYHLCFAEHHLLRTHSAETLWPFILTLDNPRPAHLLDKPLVYRGLFYSYFVPNDTKNIGSGKRSICWLTGPNGCIILAIIFGILRTFNHV